MTDEKVQFPYDADKVIEGRINEPTNTYIREEVHVSMINKILESSPIVGMYNDAEKFIDDYNKWKDKMFKEYYNG